MESLIKDGDFTNVLLENDILLTAEGNMTLYCMKIAFYEQ